MLMLKCNVCKDDDDNLPFMVPNDPQGIALMQEHLRTEHGTDAAIVS